jgi:diacylglycerol kinase family enzyme
MAVILNCSSGSNKAARQRVAVEALMKASRLDADVLCAERGEHVAELAARAARRPYDVLVAGGGDGTMSAVAAAVAGTDKVMGVLPLGTVNHFARSLGIPMRLDAAVRTLAEGQRVRIDVGEVNGRVFVNNSTLGIYPRIVRDREALRQRRGLNRWIAFALAIAAGIRRHEPVRLRLVLDGDELQVSTPFVFVANNDFRLGALDVVRRVALGSGELGVCVAHAPTRRSIVKLLASAVAGRLQGARDLSILRTSELWVEAPQRSLDVAADGEILQLTPPLRYRTRPSALQIIVPAARGAGTRAASRPGGGRPARAALPG